jgi:hypothetical protein
MQYEKAIVDADPAMRSYLAWVKETRGVELTPEEALAEVRARIDGAKQPKHDTLRLRMRRLALLLA